MAQREGKRMMEKENYKNGLLASAAEERTTNIHKKLSLQRHNNYIV